MNALRNLHLQDVALLQEITGATGQADVQLIAVKSPKQNAAEIVRVYRFPLAVESVFVFLIKGQVL